MSEQEAAEGEAAGRRRKPRRDASEKQEPPHSDVGNNQTKGAANITLPSNIETSTPALQNPKPSSN